MSTPTSHVEKTTFERLLGSSPHISKAAMLPGTAYNITSRWRARLPRCSAKAGWVVADDLSSGAAALPPKAPSPTATGTLRILSGRHGSETRTELMPRRHDHTRKRACHAVLHLRRKACEPGGSIVAERPCECTPDTRAECGDATIFRPHLSDPRGTWRRSHRPKPGLVKPIPTSLGQQPCQEPRPKEVPTYFAPTTTTSLQNDK